MHKKYKKNNKNILKSYSKQNNRKKNYTSKK